MSKNGLLLIVYVINTVHAMMKRHAYLLPLCVLALAFICITGYAEETNDNEGSQVGYQPAMHQISHATALDRMHVHNRYLQLM